VTDPSDQFSTELPPGFCDVFISATSFTPYCAKIRLNERKPANFKAKLKLAPQVSKELD
jgi:hypothetical protein